MKAIFEQLNLHQSQSFLYRRLVLPAFKAAFHFHPEYELTLIVRGEGQRYVGSHVADFSAGDLVFLGANLPHCWVSKPLPEVEMVEAIVIQFDAHFLGENFFDLPEMAAVRTFFEKSKAGIRIVGAEKTHISEQIRQLEHAPPFKKLLGLLAILDSLAHSAELENLDLSYAQNAYSNAETARFQRVFSYLIEHYKRDISLEEMAQVANLTQTSFCRYFKSMTQKTFHEILHEFRIQYACQLLKQTDAPVAQIAFDCGFGDVPYFNKLFKKHKGMAPLAYKNAHA